MNREQMLSGAFFPNAETPCGIGATSQNAKKAKVAIAEAIKLTKAKKVNDAGCGARTWWDKDLPIDVVAYDWIAWNPDIQILDITKEQMRPCDLVICRYVFNHLAVSDIEQAIGLMRAKYLLANRHNTHDHSDLAKKLKVPM